MANFIKLSIRVTDGITMKTTSRPIWINTDQVMTLEPGNYTGNGERHITYTDVVLVTGSHIRVLETPSEIVLLTEGTKERTRKRP